MNKDALRKIEVSKGHWQAVRQKIKPQGLNIALPCPYVMVATTLNFNLKPENLQVTQTSLIYTRVFTYCKQDCSYQGEALKVLTAF